MQLLLKLKSIIRLNAEIHSLLLKCETIIIFLLLIIIDIQNTGY